MIKAGVSMSVAVLAAFTLAWSSTETGPATGGSAQTSAREDYGKLPLAFEANRGQTDLRVDFLARGYGYTVFLTGAEAVVSIGADRPETKGSALRFGLVGASARQGMGREELPGKVNYLRGADSQGWRTGVPIFARVVYPNAYPGVDVVYYGTREGRLEHDFIVHPRADPGKIELRIDGATGVQLDARGDIVLDTAAGTVRLERPRIYQDTAAGRIEVAGAYQRRGRDRFGFKIADHDPSRPLIIDPVLVYSTYLDGSGFMSHGLGIAVDRSGAAFVAGFTNSADFPITPGAFDSTFNRDADVYVAKIDPTGTALVYATYLGGRRFDTLLNGCLAIDASGAAYVTGATDSPDFPTTAGALDTIMEGSLAFFVTKLDATGGALVYSTYLEGTPQPSLIPGSPNGIAVDSFGAAYIVGRIASTNFPSTPGAFDTSYNGGSDAFVTKIDPAGASLVYSTYLGGSGWENPFRIAVGASGAAIVVGNTASADFPTTPGGLDPSHNGGFDGFVTRLDPAGAVLEYSTYLGGRGSDSAFGLAIDSSEQAIVVGITSSDDFPTTAGAFDSSYNGGLNGDAFAAKIDTPGAALVYSTYLGGAADDGAYGVALDGAGAAYVVGHTGGGGFPVSSDALAPTFGGGRDIFVTTMDSGGALAYSSYLGGSAGDVATDVAVDRYGAAYVTGNTGSTDFPTTLGAFDTTQNGVDDPFVLKLCTSGTCAPAPCLECGADADGRVTICHDPPGNAGKPRTLRLPPSTLAGHCRHGDACGACEAAGARCVGADAGAGSAPWRILSEGSDVTGRKDVDRPAPRRQSRCDS